MSGWRKVFASAVVLGMIVLMVPAVATEGGDVYGYTTSPQVSGAPTTGTETVDFGTLLPVTVFSEYWLGHQFAAAADSGSSAPVDDDVVANFTLTGDLSLDGCGSADPDPNDTYVALGLWNEPFEFVAFPQKIAELRIPTAVGTYFVQIGQGHQVPGDPYTGIEIEDGDTGAYVFNALMCTVGHFTLSPVSLMMRWFDYARTTPDPLAQPQILSAPTSRVFQRLPRIGGRYEKCGGFLSLEDPDLGGSGSVHQGCTTYDVLPLLLTDASVSLRIPQTIHAEPDQNRLFITVRNVGQVLAYVQLSALSVTVNGEPCNDPDGFCELGVSPASEFYLERGRSRTIELVWFRTAGAVQPGDLVEFHACFVTRIRIDLRPANNCDTETRTAV